MAQNPDQADDSAARAYLAPSDLREHALPVQAAFGFHRGHTEELLKRAADTIERLNRELAESREAGETSRRERDQLQGRLDEEKTRAELLVGEAMLDAHRAGQAIRAEAEAAAEALLDPARQEAERLVTEARAEANQRVTDAEAECVGLAAQAEQYKLLIAAVQRHSVDVLQRALEVLSEAARETIPAGNEVVPFAEPAPEQPSSSEEDRSTHPQDEYLPEPPPADPQHSAPPDEDRDDAGFEEPHVAAEAGAPPSGPLRGTEMQESLAKDPMTRLWQNAEDRKTDAEAFEAIRARLRAPRG